MTSTRPWFSIFFFWASSFKATKKRPSHIRWYWLNRRYIGSDWNFAVQTNSYEFELSRSSIKDARHRNVWIMASEVCFESWNFSQLGIAEHSHSASQLENARRNRDFRSFDTPAFPSLVMILWLIVHYFLVGYSIFIYYFENVPLSFHICEQFWQHSSSRVFKQLLNLKICLKSESLKNFVLKKIVYWKTF